MGFIERARAHFQTRLEKPAPNILSHHAGGIYNELAVGRKIQIIGKLDVEGPAVMISNHVESSDPNKVIVACELLVQRVPIFWARKTLIEPKAEESKIVKERRAANDDLNAEYHLLPWYKKAWRQVEAWAVREFHPVPVDMGQNSIAAMRATLDLLKNHRLVVIFFQGTRAPKYDLLDVLPGVAFLVAYLSKNGLDVPVVPISVSGKRSSLRKLVVNIGESLYLKDMPGETDKQRATALEKELVDRVAKLILDPKLNRCWWLNEYLGWSKHRIDDELQKLGDQAIDKIDLYREFVEYHPDMFSPTEAGFLKEQKILEESAIFF